MNFHNIDLKFDKNKIKNKRKRTVLTSRTVALTLVTLLLVSAPVTLFSTSVFAEPSMDLILSELGFTNIEVAGFETFPSGMYEAKLLAEFGQFREINILSYYPVGTEDYQTIFTGSDGLPGNGEGDYVIPPVSKTFEVDSQFGLSLFAPYRYFTETWLNPDLVQHAMIFTNLDSPNMFIICFEDGFEGFDIDFNDMVLSIEQISPPKVVSVVRSVSSPKSDEPVTVTAQVTKGSDDIGSVFLTYQVDESGWFDIPMLLEGSGYVAEIPGQQAGSQVNYQVYAYDTKGHFGVSSVYSYTTYAVYTGFLPIAQIEYSPSKPFTDEVITFDASTSYDLDGTIESYFWDFGDDNNANGITATHAYEEDGEYAVILRVVDNEDLVGIYSVHLVVKNQPPVADFTESVSTVYQNEIVSFDASPSYDLDGTVVSYTWSFGDGAATTGVTANHRFADPGFYAVTLTVNDNDGAADDYKRSILVLDTLNEPPIASFESTAGTVTTDETISFDASESYDTDGTIEAYSWNFGDGTTATGVTVDHVFDDKGVYTVTLVVTDDLGATDDEVSSVTVNEKVDDTPDVPDNVMNEPPVAIFNKSAETASIGENISFDASESYDTDGTIEAYSWDFGDGNVVTGVTADHAYTETGNYTITLIVTDNDDADASVIAELTINTETTVSLAVLSAIGLGITALTAALLIFFFQRRRKKKRS